jgi:hypothetical protein
MGSFIKIFSSKLLFSLVGMCGVLFLANAALAQRNFWGKIDQGRYQPLANFFNFAVLDRETGLVWQACPVSFAQNNPTWTDGMHSCWNAATGNRDGWRVPTIVELRSLGTYSPNFQLPNSAPFCSSTSGEYWTSTSSLLDSNAALTLSHDGTTALNKPKSGTARIWCVRGAGAP